MRRKTRGMGSVFKYRKSKMYWIQYYVNGKRIRESTNSERESDAVALLKARHKEIAEDKPVGPEVRKTTFVDLMDIVQTEHRLNGRKMDMRGPMKHLSKSFDGLLARQITTQLINRHKERRLREGAKPATINIELAVLRQAFRIARQQDRVASVPLIKLLRQQNTRKGFFERDQFEAVMRHLPEHLQGVMHVAYLTGWRVKSEILTRQKHHVDIAAGWLRLEPGETKNREGRSFPLTAELRGVLAEQLRVTRDKEIAEGRIIPWLFHRNGKQIKSYRHAFENACRDAGLAGKLVHDFRRSAARNLERSGVPRSAAMAMIGHKTEAMYRRYSIVDEVSLREAAAKIDRISEVSEFSQSNVPTRIDGEQKS